MGSKAAQNRISGSSLPSTAQAPRSARHTASSRAGAQRRSMVTFRIVSYASLAIIPKGAVEADNRGLRLAWTPDRKHPAGIWKRVAAAAGETAEPRTQAKEIPTLMGTLPPADQRVKRKRATAACLDGPPSGQTRPRGPRFTIRGSGTGRSSKGGLDSAEKAAGRGYPRSGCGARPSHPRPPDLGHPASRPSDRGWPGPRRGPAPEG